MKVLVTGGAGFIGAHVARALLARGDEVMIIDDFNSRYNPAFKEARITHMFEGLPGVRLVRGDIADHPLMEKLCQNEKFEGVVHLAAWAGVPGSLIDPFPYSRANMQGTMSVLDGIGKSGVRRFVFASSSSVYGGRTDVPFRETDNIMRPISPYAATKVAGEALCAAWQARYDLQVSVLRFFNIYGPWGRPDGALFKFAEVLLRDEVVEVRGRSTARDFTYIDDCVRGVLQALDLTHGFEVFNIGESDAVPLPRFVAALEKALQKEAHVREVPLPAGELPVSLADISKAQRVLHYVPMTSIEQGVEKFAEWYLSWYVPRFQGTT